MFARGGLKGSLCHAAWVEKEWCRRMGAVRVRKKGNQKAFQQQHLCKGGLKGDLCLVESKGSGSEKKGQYGKPDSRMFARGGLKGDHCHAAWFEKEGACKDRAAEVRAGDRKGN